MADGHERRDDGGEETEEVDPAGGEHPHADGEDAEGGEQALSCEQVLVAVGRRPRTQGWGLENLPLDLRGRAVMVDDQCSTPMRQVWAIGDLTGEPMLAHRAMAQGEMVAELIAGKARRFAPEAIPAVCYTDPEVVTAGLSPDAAAAARQWPTTADGRG